MGLSPAILPRAQTACSRTSGSWLLRSSTKMGTAPASMTTWVCWAEPEAMFVRAQAASNWTRVWGECRNSTKRRTTPVSMTRSMGGLRSLDRSFLNLVVALICSSMLSEKTPWTIKGSSSLSCAGQRRAGGGTRPYLGLGVDALVVAVGSGAERGAGGIAGGDAAAPG